MDALCIATHPIIVGLVDPADFSVFINKDGGWDRHAFESAWIAKRDTQDIPRFEFEGFLVLQSQCADMPQLWIAKESHKSQGIAFLVSFGFSGCVFAQGVYSDVVGFKERLYLFKPPQLGGTVWSPVTAKELEQKALALLSLGVV